MLRFVRHQQPPVIANASSCPLCQVNGMKYQQVARITPNVMRDYLWSAWRFDCEEFKYLNLPYSARLHTGYETIKSIRCYAETSSY